MTTAVELGSLPPPPGLQGTVESLEAALEAADFPVLFSIGRS